jgi:ribosomal protein S12
MPTVNQLIRKPRSKKRRKSKAPALQITDITEGDRDSVAVAELAFSLRTGASGDDELVITHQ